MHSLPQNINDLILLLICQVNTEREACALVGIRKSQHCEEKRREVMGRTGRG